MSYRIGISQHVLHFSHSDLVPDLSAGGPIWTAVVRGEESAAKYAKLAGQWVCLRAGETFEELDGRGDRQLVCKVCDRRRAPTSASHPLPRTAVEHLLKLVGNSDPDVKLGILSLVKPLSNHVGVDLATCGLFLNYIEDLSQKTIRFTWSIR